MKQNIVFLLVAIIFATLSVYFFNCRGRIEGGVSIFFGFCCFLTLCAGADAAQLNERNK